MEPNYSCTQLLLLHDSKHVQIIDLEMDLQIELQQVRLTEHIDIGRIFWLFFSDFFNFFLNF